MGLPGASWGILAACWRFLGGLQEASWALLEASWGALEARGGSSRPSWRPIWTLHKPPERSRRGPGTWLSAYEAPTWDFMKSLIFIDFSMNFEVRRPPGALLEATWRLPDGSWSGLKASWRLLEAPGGLLAAAYGSQEASERPSGPDPRDIQRFLWVQGEAQDPGTTPRSGNLTGSGPWGGKKQEEGGQANWQGSQSSRTVGQSGR